MTALTIVFLILILFLLLMLNHVCRVLYSVLIALERYRIYYKAQGKGDFGHLLAFISATTAEFHTSKSLERYLRFLQKHYPQEKVKFFSDDEI